MKVVILGQDPYHGEGQAHGLCFSVNDGVRFPPSLVNIFKEIEDELGKPAPATGNLLRWSRQEGCCCSTPRSPCRRTPPARTKDMAGSGLPTASSARWPRRGSTSCSCCGELTHKAKPLSSTPHATSCCNRHTRRPSRHTGAFFGNGHFARANQYLREHGLAEIDW